MRPLDAAELEQALTILAWSDPAFAGDPYAALPQLGVEMPAGFRLDIRVQRRDTLYLIIPPASPDGAPTWSSTRWTCGAAATSSSGSCRRDAKLALLDMREQYRDRAGEDKR